PNGSGSHGAWEAQSGSLSPLSAATVPTPAGKFRAMLDEANLQPFQSGGMNQNPNAPDSYAGTHLLYQDVTIPANTTKAMLTLSLYIDNTSATTFTDPSSNSSLDYRTTAANQQVRVDIMSTLTGAVTGASNDPATSGGILITSPNHGLTSGMQV